MLYVAGMVKADSKMCTFRLRPEARFALEDLGVKWGVSQTAAFERVVIEAHSKVSGVAVDVETGEIVEGPGSVAGVRAAVVIKRYRCEHCGVSPAVPRVGDICQGCRAAGHNGEPRDCGACTTDYGTGGL